VSCMSVVLNVFTPLLGYAGRRYVGVDRRILSSEMRVVDSTFPHVLTAKNGVKDRRNICLICKVIEQRQRLNMPTA
jgi:hypothetical protein